MLNEGRKLTKVNVCLLKNSFFLESEFWKSELFFDIW